MSKPIDIPQDIWDVVQHTIYNGMNTAAAGTTIAHLIMEEREACAKAVGQCRSVDENGYICEKSDAIAAIHKRGEA